MITLIVNPVAGNGRSSALAPEVEALLSRRGLDYQRRDTRYPGHAVQLAREAVDAGAQGVVSVGGDGTLYEIVNALAHSKTALYVVPCGTGNDFIKVFKLPKDPLGALEAQLGLPLRPIDVGQVNGRYFINVSGTGIDIEVLKQTLRYKTRFQGVLPYILGVFAAIRHYVPLSARIELNGETLEKSLVLVEIANGQYIGGGMRVAPTADPTDGIFDVYCVDRVPRHAIWFLLPLFIPGWYRHLPITHRLRADRLTILAHDMTLNIDGELIDADRAEYSLHPGALLMRCPDPVYLKK